MKISRLAPLISGFASLLFLTHCALPENGPGWLHQGWAGEGLTVRRAESAVANRSLFNTAVGFNVPRQAGSLNDTARVLGGLAPSGGDFFTDVRNSGAWAAHKGKLDQMWSDFAWRHEQPIRSWAAGSIGDMQSTNALFYPFSGPDFLFAQTFFPRAETVVLCGLEPCEPLPPLSELSAGEIANGLSGLQTALSTVMQFSFFITKDMRNDLVSTRFRGVLPVILTFMARSGHRVDSIDLVALDGNGNPGVIAGNGGAAPGALIRCVGPDGRPKRVFYFRQDLSNESLHAGSPLLRFVSSLGSPPAFTKSASYLMHEGGFSVIRDYLLRNSRGLVQDPSGVPYRHLLGAGWNVQLYGNYRGTLDIFSSHHQDDLIAAYRAGKAQPLNFGIGYMYEPDRTCLMVGRPGRAMAAQ